MDLSFAAFLTERLDNRPPSQATQAWLSAQSDPMASLTVLHDQAGLPMPPSSTLDSYFSNFLIVYAPLDEVPARVTSEQLFWTLNIIALLQDAPRLKSYLRLYGNDRSVSQRSFLWLARRDRTAAMNFLLPLIKTSQGTPQPLLRQLAEIAVETGNLSHFRSAVRSLRLESSELRDWNSSWNKFLATLPQHPDQCRLLLLSVAEKQPLLVEMLIGRVFVSLPLYQD